jgi:hypothetical protein
VLLEALRRIGLKGTELARAQVATIRLRLLKIGSILHAIHGDPVVVKLDLSSPGALYSYLCCFPDRALEGVDPGTQKITWFTRVVSTSRLCGIILARFWPNTFAATTKSASFFCATTT